MAGTNIAHSDVQRKHLEAGISSNKLLKMIKGIRETKKKKTRLAILQAAVNLFREKDFEKTSVEELARASGIGKGTVYGYEEAETALETVFRQA